MKMGDPRFRICRQEAWFNYIVNELVSRIHQINKSGKKIITTGCSMGEHMQLILCLEDLMYLEE